MSARNTAYWLCQIFGWGAWTAVGLASAASAGGWRAGVVIGFLLFFGYSVGLTHLLRRVIRNRQWLALPARRMVPRLAAAAIVTGSLLAALVTGFGRVLDPRTIWSPLDVLWMAVSLSGGVVMWTSLYVAITSVRRYRETRRNELHLQLALRESELRALAAQINPHFLFNCLNTIRGTIAENPDQARDMITRLANILRYSLQQDRDHTVPLEREMEIVSDYLALESSRFEDRLRVRFEIDPAAARLPVPSMLLQTLVENAVKHGLAKLTGGGELIISANVDGGELRIRVENPGRLAESAAGSTQVGLKNARERLRLLYGDRASLELSGRDDGRVAATVLIPRTT
jgi:sensor histidine kinase YesM